MLPFFVIHKYETCGVCGKEANYSVITLKNTTDKPIDASQAQATAVHYCDKHRPGIETRKYERRYRRRGERMKKGKSW